MQNLSIQKTTKLNIKKQTNIKMLTTQRPVRFNDRIIIEYDSVHNDCVCWTKLKARQRYHGNGTRQATLFAKEIFQVLWI